MLAGVPAAVWAQPAPSSQPALNAAGASLQGEDDEDVVVVGQRQRGAVIGDVKPELQLNAGDVRALGVSSVTELLTELAPQLQSARGGSPLVLLEGRRISSFREIATLPAEAIARVDVLPEETALKYGVAPSQKVVNIVLRQRFKAVTIEARDRFATAGGGNQARGGFDFLTIGKGQRFNLSLDYTGTESLTEAQRGIATSTGGDTRRTLQPSEGALDINAGWSRAVGQTTNISINGEVTTDRTAALVGAASTESDSGALTRTVNDLTTHLGTTLDKSFGPWTTNLTATYDHAESRTITERSLDPLTLAPRSADMARSLSDTGAVDLVANGSVLALPAGPLSLTGHVGASAERFDSRTVRSDSPTAVALNRSFALGSLSLDAPILDSPSPFVGKLSVNGNGEVRTLSDAGTIRSYGFGLNWRPRPAISVIASLRQAESAPTVQQLGNPVTLTSTVPIFDYQAGTNVLVSRTSGGNPDLLNADQRDWRIGLTVSPFKDPDITFTADYNERRTRNAIAALPAATAATESAFPDRFTRDADTGLLLAIDARPVNIARQDSSVLRYGINFTKSLKTPQGQVDAMRALFRQRFPNGFPGQTGGGRGGPPDHAPGSGPAFGGGGGPRGGGGGGFRGGRMNFAVYHTVHFVERAMLAEGLPSVDLLDGGTLGSGSGEPRHEVEVQAGFAQSGLGVRLSGNWQSATRVEGLTSAEDLRFSSLGTVNLRLFANLGVQPKLVAKAPWLAGTRITIGVTNLFNARQRVTDASGATPFAYQGAYLDPLGRTVSIGIRKLFF